MPCESEVIVNTRAASRSPSPTIYAGKLHEHQLACTTLPQKITTISGGGGGGAAAAAVWGTGYPV